MQCYDKPCFDEVRHLPHELENEAELRLPIALWGVD